MKPPPKPQNEKQRQSVLESYEILNTHAETDFDDLTLVASQICNTPIAVISLIDNERQWFKSKVGLDVDETSRDISFCGHVILGTDLVEVNDASSDDRFCDNPLVTGAPHIRFYAGAPLVMATGEVLGTICVIDRNPRNLNETQKAALRTLARNVVMQLQMRLQLATLAEREKSVNQLLQKAIEFMQVKNDFFAKFPIEPADFDLTQTVQKTVQFFSWTAKEKKVALRYSGPNRPLLVNADSGRLAEILSNLISNALKLTDHGEITVRLNASAHPGGVTVCFKISDSGLGMAEQTISQFLSPYSLSNSSIKKRFGERGGLYISKSLAEAMGGELICTSELSRGSTFTFNIVLNIAQSLALAPASFHKSDFQNLKILIAEDQLANQRVFKAFLNNLGCTSTVVTCGSQAVELAARDTFDLILMDRHMPGGDGLTATRLIKAHQAATGRHVPIIAMSAAFREADHHLFLDAGIDGFLSKPFAMKDLCDVLVKWTKPRGSGGATNAA